MTELKEKTRPRRATARPVTVAMLLVFLIAAAAAQWGVVNYRFTSDAPMAGGTNQESLSSMPSFATALLLGGLRGPLVMSLWISSETQKQQNNLEDIDTKIEWIRLLQPDFDAVHLFEIWNKAYNISVKMTSLANKYSAVIDAIDYGQRVDKERPDDGNILSQLAQVFSDKLGSSQEYPYYRHRVRRETQTLYIFSFPASRVDEFRAAAPALGWDSEESPLGLNSKTQTYVVVLEKPIAQSVLAAMGGDAKIVAQTPEEAVAANRSWRRMRLPPVLDENGFILPELIKPRYPRPEGLAADQPWYDGSPLQLLAPYQPFPYGVSTFALAYNYYKRTQLLIQVWKETMLQQNDMAIDSRPGIMLKLWAQDDWDRGRRAEIESIGGSVSSMVDPLDLEIPDAHIGFDAKVVDQNDYNLALYSYATAARVFADAREEFKRHIQNDPGQAFTYFSHVDDTIAMEQFMLADHDYLEAVTASGDEREKLMRSALDHYAAAADRFALITIKYFTEDGIAAKVFPIDPATGKPRTRTTIDQADPSTWIPTCMAANRLTDRIYRDPNTGQPTGDMNQDERVEYSRYLAHCEGRMAQLSAALQPQTAPSMGQ